MADRNVVAVRWNGSKPVVKSVPKTASTAYDKNSLVEMASGAIDAVDANDTSVYGILLEEIATTDSDYATTDAKQVLLLTPDVEVEIDVTAALTVGLSYGVNDAYTVDQSDTTNKVFTCTANLSSTRARGVFKTYSGSNNL